MLSVLDEPVWQIALVLLAGVPSLLAAEHALLHKRDSRSAMAWITFSMMFPLLGPLFYYLFGKNRIRTRARKLHGVPEAPLPIDLPSAPALGIDDTYLNLARLSEAVTQRPLLPGNRVQALENGEEAYPAMLEAIQQARQRVYMSTYIFERGGIGQAFIEALQQAHQRGVTVRVLVDGVGKLYDFPTAAARLRALGVPVAEFLPPRLWPPNLSINLRNHRKILLVDSQWAFTGGMNIRQGHLLLSAGGHPVRDLHFRLEGPVVPQLEDIFRADWLFTTDEPLPAPASRYELPQLPWSGAACRVIEDGPSEDLDKLPRVLVGAIALAQRSVKIITPYFLPPRELVVALQTAALRGVAVTIILPEQNNLPFVQWASNHMLKHLVETGIQLYFRQGSFVHTKLFVIDDYYALIGSSNLDPRSLRLNFELQVEVFDRETCTGLAGHFVAELSHSRRVEVQALRARPYWMRLRDALAWLASPYL